MNLKQLRTLNQERAVEWRERDGGGPTWTGADWSNEMCGEAGEAANVVKKLRRIETGYGGPSKTEDELLQQLAEELADVVICADLVGIHYGIDLASAVPDKFNATSDKQGLVTRF